jgi:hypothetical protein
MSTLREEWRTVFSIYLMALFANDSTLHKIYYRGYKGGEFKEKNGVPLTVSSPS